MAVYYEDGTFCPELDITPDTPTAKARESPRAIGWLGSEASYEVGELGTGVRRCLQRLLESPWQQVQYAGLHRCELCAGSQPPHHDGGALVVPGRDDLFVAPRMIAHYIDTHGYCPPKSFQDAVLNSPPMKSLAYFQALRRHDVWGYEFWVLDYLASIEEREGRLGELFEYCIRRAASDDWEGPSVRVEEGEEYFGYVRPKDSDAPELILPTVQRLVEWGVVCRSADRISLPVEAASTTEPPQSNS